MNNMAQNVSTEPMEEVNSIEMCESEMQEANSNARSAGSGSTDRSPAAAQSQPSRPGEDPCHEQRQHKETRLSGDTCPCQAMDREENKSTSINLHKHGFIVCPVSPSSDDRLPSQTPSQPTSSSLHLPPPTCSPPSQMQLLLQPPPQPSQAVQPPTPIAPNAATTSAFPTLDRHGNVITGAFDSYTLHPVLSLNNNNNNQDTITSVRSRCVSISRRTYNTTDFNQEFSKIDDTSSNKTNPFKRMVKSTAFKRTTTTTPAATATQQPVNQQQKTAGKQVNRQNDLPLSRRSSNSSNISQMSPIGITPDDEGDTDGPNPLEGRKRGPGAKALSYLRKLFPIVNSFKNYSREDLVSDCISALTVIVFHVPQAMGYSLIAQGEY